MTEPVTSPASPASPQAVAALSDLETDWRRLDPRMLLVHIVQETVRFLPVLLGILILGRGDDGRPNWLEYVFVPLVVGVSLLRYLTTRYRITNGQIELRKGLLNKQLLATPADRVRTVDVTSSMIHRVLGLGKVELGTAGSGHGDRLILDALTLPEAHHLRDELIHLRQVTAAPTPAAGIPVGSTAPPPTGEPYVVDAPVSPPLPAAPVETEVELLRLDPRWVRYAPATMTGVVSALAIFGFASQFLTRILERGLLTEAFDRIGDYAWWVDSLVGVAAVLVLVTVLSVIGYLLQFWRFRLSRHSGGTLHVTRGLLTSRATSIEEKRIRGLEVGEPLGFDNTFALVMTRASAGRLGVRRISDLGAHAADIRVGLFGEFLERDDGMPGLARAYGLRFGPPPREMDLGLLYQALLADQVDLVVGSATDGLIAAHDLVVLEDDRHYFPPYDAVPVMNESSLLLHPGLLEALDSLAGRID
ncbi:MAG TPA: glycine betaine ABC transporter substrate-binding protein, partial [Lapillicoccus sp.]